MIRLSAVKIQSSTSRWAETAVCITSIPEHSLPSDLTQYCVPEHSLPSDLTQYSIPEHSLPSDLTQYSIPEHSLPTDLTQYSIPEHSLQSDFTQYSHNSRLENLTCASNWTLCGTNPAIVPMLHRHRFLLFPCRQAAYTCSEARDVL